MSGAGQFHNPLRGMLLMAAGVLAFAVTDAAAKWLTSSYPVVQLLFLSRLATLVFAIMLASRSGIITTLRTKMIEMHALRALLNAITVIAFFLSLRFLPLADAVTINFSEVLFMCALSALLLKEQVGARRWIAVLLGFVGVVIVMRPNVAGFSIGSALALSAAISNAFMMIVTRRMSATESSQALLFWSAALPTIFVLPIVWAQWVMPSPTDALVFAVLALSGTLGQYFVAEAVRHGEVSLIAPLEYTSLVWAAVFGFAFWSEIPGPSVFLGGSIIIICNLYVARSEVGRVVPSLAPSRKKQGHP